MDPIIVTDLNITGRVTERDARLGNVFVTYNMDLSSAANYVFQFGIQSQMQTFGVVKSLFLDNGSNPSDVEVAVTGTDQFFTVPAYSIGIYTVDANQGSNISVVTAGGATDICTITFYNWERPPVVWYSFGAFNSDTPLKAYGTMSEGDTVATEPFKQPIYIGGIDRATGEFRGVGVDALGRLDFSSSISIGGVFGADPMGAAPVNPGLVQAVLDSTGDIAYVELNANSEFKVHDEDLKVLITTLNADTAIIKAQSAPPSTGAITVVASVITDQIILASNVNRKGAIIFNDSTSALKLAFANVDATLSYSITVNAGGNYILSKGDYTGVIKGTWVTANGNAIVTELV